MAAKYPVHPSTNRPLHQRIAVGALLCISILLLPPSTFAASKSEAEVVIRLWNEILFEPPVTGVRKIVEDFNATHPTIHIDLLNVPQMSQKLLTAVAGGVPPDLAIFDRFRVASYAERGAFLPITQEALAAGIDESEFFEAPWDECVYQRELYAIPFNTDVRVLYYNKQLFREAGLDPERPPQTWTELREYSERLTRRRNGRLEQVGFVPYHGFGNTWLYLFGWQKGAEYLSEDGRTATLDHPKLLEALEWVREFTADYGVRNLTFFASGLATREQDPFLTGQMAMIGEEVFMLARIRRFGPDLDFGIAPLPWPEDGRRVTWSGGFALVVPTGTPHVEEAMEVAAYLSSREAQFEFGVAANSLPANRLAAETSFYQDDPHWQALVAEMEYSVHRPVTPVSQLMWDEMSRAWEYGASGDLEPNVALARAQRNVQEELNRLYERYAFPEVNWYLVTAITILIVGGFLAWRISVSWREVRKLSLHRSEAVAGYIFASPVLFGLLAFWVGPIVVAAVYSFCHYDVLTSARWAGTANYQRLFFDDPLFWKSLWNTIYFVAFAVPTSIIGSLGLALLLNAKIAGRSFWRTLFYLPAVVPLVAMSLLFLWLFNAEYGLFNVVLSAVGLPRVPWMSDPYFSKPSLILMNMWTVGAGMIIFLAGLQGVPRHLYESAVIDGAGVFQRFINITIPMLSPTIFFMLVINTINAFQVFTQAYLMTDGTGAPRDSVLFYVFYLFRQGFEYFNMGYASAMAWLMFLIILVITIFQFVGARRWVYTEGGN